MCRWLLTILTGAALVLAAQMPLSAQGKADLDGAVDAKKVYDAIERAKRWLLKRQRADGSWLSKSEDYPVGGSSLVMLALLNSGMTPKDPAIQRGLKYLREVESTEKVYEVSLQLMVFATAKDGRTDVARMTNLVSKLERSQVTAGPYAGLWDYMTNGTTQLGGDGSNGQFAVLGLREAQEAGIPVSMEVWRRARDYWMRAQDGSGGWGYRMGVHASGSMTVAGLASLSITEAMARFPEEKQDIIDCCADVVPDNHIEKGCHWLGQRFSVGANPGEQNWWLYYLYGLERAGRLSGRRFFGQRDWYREGAKLLSENQQASGEWASAAASERDSLRNTCFALLFLSKGLAPVLINKLQYGPSDNSGTVIGTDWNNSRDDVRNLVQQISGLDKWPKLLNWQVVELPRAELDHLLQAPMLVLSGRQAPRFTAREIKLLREYIDQGGFIFAEASCHSEEFHTGFTEVIKQMFPDGEGKLELLKTDHPVYRAEYLIDPGKDGVRLPLYGVDVGCRTAIIYSKQNDLCCLWDHSTNFALPKRSLATTERITRGVHIGVNLVAYATGREVPDKLQPKLADDKGGAQDQIERGLIQIAKLRYSGEWDAAPQALRNVLLALNRTMGSVASTKQKNLGAQDQNIFKYPMLFLHGRQDFSLGTQEQANLKLYVTRGNVLFVDACCSAPQFDKAFRKQMQQMFPNQPLVRIPVEHELFRVGLNVQRVKRRELNSDQPDAALQLTVKEGPPILEGIEINGRYVVIYSKYDMSCALEKQSSAACAGYLHDDAVKLAINIVMYAMLQ